MNIEIAKVTINGPMNDRILKRVSFFTLQTVAKITTRSHLIEIKLLKLFEDWIFVFPKVV